MTENTKRYRVPHCDECERCQCTDFIYKDYYCCEENDTMRIFGRLGVDHPPKTSPKWCPKRIKNNGRNHSEDIIKMDVNTELTDKDGKIIEIKVPEPEYMVDSIW